MNRNGHTESWITDALREVSGQMELQLKDDGARNHYD